MAGPSHEDRARDLLEKYRNAYDACEAQRFADLIENNDADVAAAEREMDDIEIEIDVERLTVR